MRLALADIGSHMDAPLWMVLLVCTVVLIAFQYIRHLRRPPHRHQWEQAGAQRFCTGCGTWDRA